MNPTTDSGGCADGARLWRSPKSNELVRNQYLDGWPLSRVLAGALNRWAGGWTLRVGVHNQNIDYKDQVSEGMTGCIGTGFPRFPCALVRMRYNGGLKAAANFTREIVIVKDIYEQVAKWHWRSQSRKDIQGEKNQPHSSYVVSHTALNWYRLPISGQDFRHWPLSDKFMHRNYQWNTLEKRVRPQCTLSATSGKR